MKPNEVRRRRQMVERQRAARGEALEEFVRGGGDTAKVDPALIPGQDELEAAQRTVRKLLRKAERTPRAKRAKVLDELVVAMARLVFCEAVMALDPLERAGLAPARLVQMSRGITSEVLQVRLAEWRGDFGLEVSR